MTAREIDPLSAKTLRREVKAMGKDATYYRNLDRVRETDLDTMGDRVANFLHGESLFGWEWIASFSQYEGIEG